MQLFDILTLHPPVSVTNTLGAAKCFRNTDGCSGADVFYVDRGAGLYLKTAKAGALKNAAAMQEIFYRAGLSAQPVLYESTARDWLLIERVPGENAIHPSNLRQPQKLAALMGEAARRLHETKVDECPIKNLSAHWKDDFLRLFERGAPLATYVSDYLGIYTPETALREVEASGDFLSDVTLIHGDLCMPNYMFDASRFSGFIDLDSAGIGDKNCDLFWTLWSMNYNFGSDRCRSVFLDAYGRDAVDEEKIRMCGMLFSLRD